MDTYDFPKDANNEVREPMAQYLSLRSGYTTQYAIDFITKSFIHTIDKAAKIFGVSKRTIQDWGRSHKTLQSQYGDTLIELEEIMKVGLITFGQDQAVLDAWMETPLSDLGHRAPSDILDNTVGRKIVLNFLHSYQHGFFA